MPRPRPPRRRARRGGAAARRSRAGTPPPRRPGPPSSSRPAPRSPRPGPPRPATRPRRRGAATPSRCAPSPGPRPARPPGRLRACGRSRRRGTRGACPGRPAAPDPRRDRRAGPHRCSASPRGRARACRRAASRAEGPPSARSSRRRSSSVYVTMSGTGSSTSGGTAAAMAAWAAASRSSAATPGGRHSGSVSLAAAAAARRASSPSQASRTVERLGDPCDREGGEEFRGVLLPWRQRDRRREVVRAPRHVAAHVGGDEIGLLLDPGGRRDLPQHRLDLLAADLDPVGQLDGLVQLLVDPGVEDLGVEQIGGVRLAQDRPELPGGGVRPLVAEVDADLEAVGVADDVGGQRVDDLLHLIAEPLGGHDAEDDPREPPAVLRAAPEEPLHPAGGGGVRGERLAGRLADPRLQLLLEQPPVDVGLPHQRQQRVDDVAHDLRERRVDGQLVALARGVADGLAHGGRDQRLEFLGRERTLNRPDDPGRLQPGRRDRVLAEIDADCVRLLLARLVDGRREDVVQGDPVGVGLRELVRVEVGVQERRPHALQEERGEQHAEQQDAERRRRRPSHPDHRSPLGRQLSLRALTGRSPGRRRPRRRGRWRGCRRRRAGRACRGDLHLSCTER